MSYTKRNINAIALLLTILAFICLHLINSQVSLLINSKHRSNNLNSKTVPIQNKSNNILTISILDNISENLIGYKKEKKDTVSILQKEMEKVRLEKLNNKTQRQILLENKWNKWRIEIPKIGLNAHIEEGTNSNVLLRAVGHFEETDKFNGNVCLAAHNRGHLCNFFEKIKQLKMGDEIIYYTPNGKRVYKVQTNSVILETDWRYIEQTKDNRITLITCEENRGKYRRCIQAVQVAEI